MTTIKGWKKEHPFKYEKGEHITSQEAVEVLYEESKGEAIITLQVLDNIRCGQLSTTNLKNLELTYPPSVLEPWVLVILPR